VWHTTLKRFSGTIADAAKRLHSHLGMSVGLIAPKGGDRSPCRQLLPTA